MGEFSKIIKANGRPENCKTNLKIKFETGVASFKEIVDGEMVVYLTNNKGGKIDEKNYLGRLSWRIR